MHSQHDSDHPLRELKHEAVPGYRTAFAIALVGMAIYLAVILYTSPGQVKYPYPEKKDQNAKEHSENHRHQDSNKQTKPNE